MYGVPGDSVVEGLASAMSALETHDALAPCALPVSGDREASGALPGRTLAVTAGSAGNHHREPVCGAAFPKGAR